MHLINVLHSSWRISYPPILSIRVCNPKEPRTVSCRTLRERSLHNMPCPLYSTAVLNLNTFTCIFLQVFLSCTLVAPKYTKRPAYVKNSRLLLCSQVASNILQSQQTCHFNPICLEQGVAKLAPHGCIRKLHPCCTQTFSHNGLLKTGIYVVFLSMPVLF